MELTFNELKSREIINIYDGKRLGRASDIIFDSLNMSVIGIVVPGEQKLFRKSDDIFIPISKVKKIGEDVLLVKLSPDISGEREIENLKNSNKNNDNSKVVYARYRRVVQKEK